MFAIRIRLWLTCALLCGGAVYGQMDPQGMIIKIEQAGLFYIDLGQRDNVMAGDFFDIVADEVLTHPLTEDTLAVTQKTVGALRVRQVWEKTSLVQLLHIQGGENPMRKQIVRIKDPDRLLEIEQYNQRWMYGGTEGPSKNLALIPGLYQLKMGDKTKGWSLIGLEAAAFIAGIAYRSDSNDWKDTYDNLPAGLPEERYAFYFDGAQDRRNRSNRLFWLVGAIYAYNLVDVMWLDSGQTMNLRRSSLPLELGLDRDGRTALQWVYRF